MNRKSITLVVVVVLCIAAFGYNKGWFSPSSPSAETQSDEVSANQMLDQDQATDSVAKPPSTTTESTSPVAE